MASSNNAKRACAVIENGSPQWEDLNPEIMSLIFTKIDGPVEEMVRTVVLVCKSWLHVVVGPYCWLDIDIEHWCRRRTSLCHLRPDNVVDSVVRKLVRRSKFTFRRLSAYKLGDPGFVFVANCAKCLKILQIPMSDVTDKMVEKHASSLANVTVLDISYCLKITSKGLEQLGEKCKSLVQLKRNMPPPEWSQSESKDTSKIDNSEALAIAKTMVNLNNLELAFGRFNDYGLDAILMKCGSLTHLDIQGSWSVELEGDLENRCSKVELFQSPWHDDDYDNCGSPSENHGFDQEDSDLSCFSDESTSESDD